MCIDANFERFSDKDSICWYLDKAKETGFNQVVVDVRGVDGLVLYESDFLPKLTEVDGFKCERDWDYLQYFLDEAKKRDLKVTVSATVFPAGSQYHDRGLIYEDPSIADLTFPTVLWSETAMVSSPEIAAIFTMLLGVISLSPQGDKAE